MQPDHVLTIAKREFLVRIRSKGFWIATIVLPLFMSAMLFVPAFLAAHAKSSQRLVVVDQTGRVAAPLAAELARQVEKGEGLTRFEVEVEAPAAGSEAAAEAQRQELDRRVLDDDIDAWVWIDEKGLADDEVEYHAESVSNLMTQESLAHALSSVVRELRLSEAGYDSALIEELSRSVDLTTVRISAEGSRAEEGVGGLVLAVGLFFMLYMVILIYGNQVMQGVLEEKSSRIVEVMLSSVRPVEMMAGKLAGICLLGLVQLAVWMTTAVVLTAPGLVAAVAMLPEDAPIPEISAPVVVHFFLHFLMGYFLFASFYAMLGAAFNDAQEAQQLAGVAVVFVVAPALFLMPVINDPNSTLAVVTSLIPPMTPLVMMLRIAVEPPPLWQILLGYALGFGFTGLVVYLAARVYRVGILMYGKRPTIPEIWRWMRYAG